VDTGAEVTALSDSTWKSLGITTPLKSVGLPLFGPELTWKKMLPLTYNGNTCTEEVFVVKGLKNNLLGLPTIKELSLITNVCAIENGIISQYPSLLHGRVPLLRNTKSSLSQTVNHFH